jgi:cation transport ATPase
VDDVSKMGAYRSHEVRIAVPQTERDMAVNILAEFEQRDKSRISELVNVTNGIFLLVVALLVLVAVVGIFDKNGKWFIAVWILIVACAGAALIRLAWGKKSRDIK